MLVPIRVIAENMGSTVSYEAKDRRVSIEKDEITMSLTIGESTIWYSDREKSGPVKIDSPAIIKNSRTMIPLRAVAELFNMEVKWDGKERAVYIDKNPQSAELITIDNAGDKLMETLKVMGSLDKDSYVSEILEYEADYDGLKVKGFWVTLRKNNPNDSSLSELVDYYFIDKTGNLVLVYDIVNDRFENIF